MNRKMFDTQRLQEEDGFSTYLIGLSLCFGMLILMTIFIPYMGLFTTRRVSQLGVDAAVLASAEFYAEELSIDFPRPVPMIGACGEPLPSVRYRAVMAYQAYYQAWTYANQGQARAEANRLASANRTNLDNSQYSVSIIGMPPNLIYYQPDTGIPFSPILIQGRTTRAWSAINSSWDVPGYAKAAAFIKKTTKTEESFPCGEGLVFWTVQYHWYWDLTLVH